MSKGKILFPLILFASLLGCPLQNKETLPQPEANEAWITFLSGDITVTEPGGSPVAAQIGQSLPAETLLQTGPDSFCDLQIGEGALIQVDENTLLSLSSLFNKDGSLSVLADMKQGTAVSKVRKLLNDETFEVQTETTVVGVRGTQFLFTVSEETGATLAVTEGAVQIKPDMTDMNISPSRELEEAFPLILEDQEITVTPELIRINKELFDTAGQAGDQEKVLDAASRYGYIAPLSRNNRERLLSIHESPFFSTKRSKLPISYTVQAVIEEASIYINNRYAGKGRCTGAVNSGDPLSVEIRAPGYIPVMKVIFPQEGEDNFFNIPQEKSRGTTFSLTLDIPEGEISVNGTPTGKNKLELTLEQEESSIIEASAPGFIPAAILIDSDTEQREIKFQLEKEITWIRQVSYFPVNGVLPTENLLTVMDGGGRLSGIDPDGNTQWELQTSNTSVKTFSPVSIGKAAALSGLEELICFNPDTGDVYFRKPLAKGEQHIFGRRPAAHPEGILFPTDTGYTILSLETGEEKYTVEVPKGTKMTPLIMEDWTAVVNTRGVVYFYGNDGKLLGEIPTSASDVIALSLTTSPDGRYGFMADKDGTVVCINLDTRKQLWSRPLSAEKRIPVSENLSLWKNTLIVYSRGSLYALDSRDGTPVYSMEDLFTAAPLLYKGVLYGGKSDGELVLMNAETGETLHTIPLNTKISCRPVTYEDKIYMGTTKGELAVIPQMILPEER